MDLIIRRIDSGLASTFASFLDSLKFPHAPDWASCYCRYYFIECTQPEWEKRSGPENRSESLEAISQGKMDGYLAFRGDACIGWCNANDVRNLKRLSKDLEPYVAGRKIGCTICFVIHPDHRRKGVATALLKQAISDFEADGYDGMLALPSEPKDCPEREYRGSIKMYERLGYTELDQLDGCRVMMMQFDRRPSTSR